MPVTFIVTKVKFTPQQHSELRAIVQTMYASECFLSLQMSVDLLLDAAGNGTLVIRWPTKESYIPDQKAVVDLNHPTGVCDAVAKSQMGLEKLAGVKPSDMKFSTMTSIAPSLR